MLPPLRVQHGLGGLWCQRDRGYSCKKFTLSKYVAGQKYGPVNDVILPYETLLCSLKDWKEKTLLKIEYSQVYPKIYGLTWM